MLKKLLVALSIASAAFATSTSTACTAPPPETPIGEFGNYCVSINGVETWGPVNTKDGDTLANQDGDIGWTIGAFQVDPFFNWTFTTNINGVYAVAFVMPYIGGPFSHVASSASGTVTAGGGPVTVKNITVSSLVNAAAIGQVLALADTTVNPPNSGNIAPVNDLKAFVSPIGPGTYGVALAFEHTGSGPVTLNGRIEILNLVPEPATAGLIGAALVGIGLLARRKAA